jgi:hypothetical protein
MKGDPSCPNCDAQRLPVHLFIKFFLAALASILIWAVSDFMLK